MKPPFLDRPEVKAPRAVISGVDYASPLTIYERSHKLADLVLAAALVGAIAAAIFGALP